MAERPKRNARKKLSAEEILEILEDYQDDSRESSYQLDSSDDGNLWDDAHATDGQSSISTCIQVNCMVKEKTSSGEVYDATQIFLHDHHLSDSDQHVLLPAQSSSTPIHFAESIAQSSVIPDDPIALTEATAQSSTTPDDPAAFAESAAQSSTIPGDPAAFAESAAQSSATPDALGVTQSFVGRPRRGRKRKCEHTNREMKKMRYGNESFKRRSGKVVLAKVFDQNYRCDCKIKFCDCAHKCSCPKKSCTDVVDKKEREAKYTMFKRMADYAAQNAFIAASVHEYPKRRGRSQKINFSRTYSIEGVSVCKQTFLHTYRISSNRVNTTLKKVRGGDLSDKRGQKQGGWNRAKPEAMQSVIDHINKFPRYISHYCRSSTDSQYLSPELTLAQMYRLYKEECSNAIAMSEAFYKKVFYRCFNLKFKKLKKDTCKACDKFKTAVDDAGTPKEKADIEALHSDHLRLAKQAEMLMKRDLQEAGTNVAVETLTFDLQKTMSLPKIPTNIVYYKRQLSMFNFGVHSGSTNAGFCYVWLENEAGRGAQEVGSCLQQHIQKKLLPLTENLILWSDSCGGQNRNIKLTLFLQYILQNHNTLQTITVRFRLSGHSFLPNDSEFGDIECAMKRQQRLYTVDDFVNVIKSCRVKNKFIVHRMTKEMFESTGDLEKSIINRKSDTTGEKISWLHIREVKLVKDKPFSIFIRTSFDDDAVSEVNIEKRQRGRPVNVFLRTNPLMWPGGKPLSAPKVADITSLLHLIPVDCHTFFTNLLSSDTIVDDTDAFGGEPDFEIEND